jgi:hypothetical protein
MISYKMDDKENVFQFPLETRVFLFSRMARPPLEHIQHSVQSVYGTPTPWVEHLNPVPYYIPIFHTPSWHSQEQPHLFPYTRRKLLDLIHTTLVSKTFLQWPPMTQLQYQVSLKIDETLSELEY